MCFSVNKSDKVLSNNQYLNDYLSEQVKEFLTGLIEKLLIEEFDVFVNRKRYGRISKTGIRQYRNGYRKRYYLTKFCVMMQLKIPRSRYGQFSPIILENKGLLDTALEDILIHQWSEGNSYRDIKNFVEKVYGEKISLGLIHRMVIKVDEYVKEYHERKIIKNYDAIYIDGLGISIKDHPPRMKNEFGLRKSVKTGKNMTLLGVVGQRREGKKIIREMIDYRIAETENTESYTKLLLSMKRRGLKADKFKLAIHDGAESISASLKNVYRKEKILEQECMFHKLMNITKLVKNKYNEKELRKDVWGVYSQKNIKLYMSKEKQIKMKWIIKEPEAMICFSEPNEKLKTKYNFDEKIHKAIHTNNPIERYFREIRRRTKAIGIFENEKSADRLIFLIVESINQKRGSFPTNINLKFTH